MRTRNADSPKTPVPAKKTPPARKSATKMQPTPSPTANPSESESVAKHASSASKHASAGKGKGKAVTKTNDVTPEQPKLKVAANVSGEATADAKPASGTKVVKKIVKRTVIRKKTPGSAKSASAAKKIVSPAKVGEEPVAKESVEAKGEENVAKGSVEAKAEGTVVKESVEKKVELTIVKETVEDKVEEPAMKESVGDKIEEHVVKESVGDKIEEHVVKESVGDKIEEHVVKESAGDKIEEHVVEERVGEKLEEPVEEESLKDVGDVDPATTEGSNHTLNEIESAKVEVPEHGVTDHNVELSPKYVKDVTDTEETTKSMEVDANVHISTGDVGSSMKLADCDMENVGSSLRQEDSEMIDVEKSLENQDSGVEEKEGAGVESKKPMGIIEDKLGPMNEHVVVEKDFVSEELEKRKEEEEEEANPEEEQVCLEDENMDKDIGIEADEEYGEEELAQNYAAENEASEHERAELTVAAEERRRRKELEIFVGGLDRDASEEEVKKAFENVGEVLEVRVHKDISTNKNKGYAFVKFAKKEQAARALAEMKNPVIHGKRCGTAPSEDNDTLFLGNICNTWTKEAIGKKLKEYGIEGVEKITLVADAQREGLSRGFAFLEFTCHPDAMVAFKRLQKPDVIFGHPERTAKVAFAEPLREPDPEVLSQIKSVFVDGLPPQWDEDTVKEQLAGYGEIERVMLARNMSTAKRKDFGFVDFTTHEAAVACIEGLNNKEIGDKNLKTKVRARLSNPLPKTQAVKGGMSGGFRIGHGTGPSFQKFGRGFRRNVHPSNRPIFQRGRGFYQHGPGQSSRMGFANEYEPVDPYPSFRGRQNFGRGGRWEFRGARPSPGEGTGPGRFDRHTAVDRDRGRHMPIRQPYLPEEDYNGPFAGRHFDEPYYYGNNSRGVKRPFFADHDLDYIEQSRARPRMDYSDPAMSHPGTRYRGEGSDLRSRDYYGYDYDGGAYSSFYGGDRPYGGRYYY